MALFDMLKNQAAQAARSAGNQAAQNLGQAARNAAANMGNKTYTVTLQQLPVNLAQMQAMPEAALKAGKRLAFPRCHPDTCTMTYGIVSSLDDLVEGAYGILEPREDAEIYVPAPYKHDICVVPAVCFDKKGYRIGYGKGYYDRFLSGFGGTSVGFCLSRFLCDSLPRGRYDRAVDLIITEKGVIAPQ